LKHSIIRARRWRKSWLKPVRIPAKAFQMNFLILEVGVKMEFKELSQFDLIELNKRLESIIEAAHRELRQKIALETKRFMDQAQYNRFQAKQDS